MKRWVSHIIVFIVGILLGITLFMALAFYNIHQEKGKALIGPRVFGDIRLVPEKDSTHQVLSFQKDNVCFMIISQDSNGTTQSVSSVSRANQSASRISGEIWQGGFMMQPTRKSGDWWCGYGGTISDENVIGELFFDLNFDGQFDTKYIADGDGKKISYIFTGGNWRKVIKASFQKAKDDLAAFYFDPNSGWLQNDANLPDKQEYQ